jgi:hypothetical protein
MIHAVAAAVVAGAVAGPGCGAGPAVVTTPVLLAIVVVLVLLRSMEGGAASPQSRGGGGGCCGRSREGCKGSCGDQHEGWSVRFIVRHVFPVRAEGGGAFADQQAGRMGCATPQGTASVYAQKAAGVRIVNLPGLTEHQDVSDYLAAGHSGEDLLQELKGALQWFPSTNSQKLFVSAPAFVAQVPDRIDWLVEKIIARGANSFFAANPKTGKSWGAIDLGISLALGCPWLGFEIPRPVGTREK